jgi:hypothetical protein
LAWPAVKRSSRGLLRRRHHRLALSHRRISRTAGAREVAPPRRTVAPPRVAPPDQQDRARQAAVEQIVAGKRKTPVPRRRERPVRESRRARAQEEEFLRRAALSARRSPRLEPYTPEHRSFLERTRDRLSDLDPGDLIQAAEIVSNPALMLGNTRRGQELVVGPETVKASRGEPYDPRRLALELGSLGLVGGPVRTGAAVIKGGRALAGELPAGRAAWEGYTTPYAKQTLRRAGFPLLQGRLSQERAVALDLALRAMFGELRLHG